MSSLKIRIHRERVFRFLSGTRLIYRFLKSSRFPRYNDWKLTFRLYDVKGVDAPHETRPAQHDRHGRSFSHVGKNRDTTINLPDPVQERRDALDIPTRLL